MTNTKLIQIDNCLDCPYHKQLDYDGLAPKTDIYCNLLGRVVGVVDTELLELLKFGQVDIPTDCPFPNGE